MLRGLKKKMNNGKDKSSKNADKAKQQGKSVTVPAVASTNSARRPKPEETAERPLYTKADLLRPIPTFQETSPSNHQNLFVQKLRLCRVQFNWDEDGNPKDHKAKEAKRKQLLDLVDYIGKNPGVYNDVVLPELMAMVSVNLFRALPPPSGAPMGEGDDEDGMMFEASWPHLQIVYEFFLRFIVSGEVDVRVLKKYIHGAFVLQVLSLFNSEDHRERDYLKTILHRIYAKFMSLRAFIRKSINHTFFVFVYETGFHNGIPELLEILGSIINGFALPLKAEHKQFLGRVLTPMHKVTALNTFHQQLSYCVTQFVGKDSALAIPVVKGLIKYWPATNAGKEVLFLNELEELLELTDDPEFKALLIPLGTKLSQCISSPHFQVAERVLFFWHNDNLSAMFADHRAQFLPIIYPSLKRCSETHWNSAVSNLAASLIKIFSELDQELTDECEKVFESNEEKLTQTKALRKASWQRLQEAFPSREKIEKEKEED